MEWPTSINSKTTEVVSVTLTRSQETVMNLNKIDYFNYLNQVKSMAKPGYDQSKYYGRGGIHLTGYDNYNGFTKYMNSKGDKTDYTQPSNAAKLSSDPSLIADSAAYYWKTFINPLDKDGMQSLDKNPPLTSNGKILNSSIDYVSRKVNSGEEPKNGKTDPNWTDRQTKTNNILKELSNPTCPITKEQKDQYLLNKKIQEASPIPPKSIPA